LVLWRAIQSRLGREQTFLVLQSVLAALAITPFGLWRLWRGNVAQAWFDLVLVGTLLLLAALGVFNRHLRLVSVLFALVYTVGSAVVVYRVGPAGLFWVFPAVVAVFFVVRAREAFVISLLGLALNTFLALRLTTPFETMTFVVTNLLVCVFVYIFSSRLRLDNYRLLAESTVDPLTRAGNRRLMDDTLAHLVAEPHGPHAVLMLDIDFFKTVNDRFGHATGDLCLSRLSTEVMGLLRNGEKWFRYGGEEFVLLVPGDDAIAVALAERIRVHVAQAALVRETPITVSIGVASHWPGESVHAWLRRADDALYEAKNTGRNRVCVSAPFHRD
jgi:diguanylate cyclase (GGDEF)-like protein